MKNNLIELSVYRDPEPFDYAGYNRRAAIRFRSSIVEALLTLSITGCTIFCCYLAWTML